MMPLSKEDEKWIYTFIKEELRFMPDVNIHSPFLPFRIQRPFAVFDISSMQEGTDLMDELIIEALCNSLPIGHKLYSINWNHSCVLYDPRNAETAQGDDEFPFFTKNGLVYFNSFFLMVITISSLKNTAGLVIFLILGERKYGYLESHC